MTSPLPAPGWYPSSDGNPYERWWDGTRWAEQTRPAAAVVQPSRMVTYQPVRTSHTFHLIMSLLTCGLWAVFVWLPMTVLNSMSRRKVVTRIR